MAPYWMIQFLMMHLSMISSGEKCISVKSSDNTIIKMDDSIFDDAPVNDQQW